MAWSKDGARNGSEDPEALRMRRELNSVTFTEHLYR